MQLHKAQQVPYGGQEWSAVTAAKRIVLCAWPVYWCKGESCSLCSVLCATLLATMPTSCAVYSTCGKHTTLADHVLCCDWRATDAQPSSHQTYGEEGIDLVLRLNK